MSAFVSVIIPVRNEEKYIAGCMESIVSQTYSKACMEILLVDGLSDDGTRQIIKSYVDKYPYIRILDNDKRIPPTALNIGIRASKGDIIVRMDAHTKYDRDYITNCVEVLRQVVADNVGGPIVTMPGDDTVVARAIAVATSNSFGVGNSKFRTSQKAQYVDTVPFGAFRKQVFDRVGLFNERLIRNQDIELNARIRKAGGKIYLDPRIRSYYYNRTTLKSLWIQNFRNGMWNIFTHAVSGNPLSMRHYIPLFFVLCLIGGTCSLFFSPFGLFFLGPVILSHLFASLFFSVRLGLKHGRRLIVPLVAVFFTLHFSYGYGSFWGLLKVIGWRKQESPRKKLAEST